MNERINERIINLMGSQRHLRSIEDQVGENSWWG